MESAVEGNTLSAHAGVRRKPRRCALILEEARISHHEGLQLAQYAVEMAPHRLSRARNVALGDRGVYGMMLGEGPLHATGLRKQRSTHPLEMRPDGVEDFAHANEVQTVGHLAMEAGV